MPPNEASNPNGVDNNEIIEEKNKSVVTAPPQPIVTNKRSRIQTIDVKYGATEDLKGDHDDSEENGDYYT